jgi:hypothetical protein
MHAASLLIDDASPPVARIRASDLYRRDYPDESETAFWYRPLEGPLPTTVTMPEKARIGVTESRTFEISLDWLDTVIGSDLLIEFDLLNQAMAALATHDYPLTVVAGWTVCELRVRSIGVTSGVPGGTDSKIFKVCNALRDAGLLTPEITDRLHTLRKQRNSWIHEGGEPDEEVAVEAVALTTEILRDVLPDFGTRVTVGLLLL